jgi:hypothetical protein
LRKTAIVVGRPKADEHPQMGQKQLRTQKKSTDEKARWTYEARQEIHGYFKDGVRPIGKVGKGLLILSGAHARLSNICEDGKWVKSEQFYVGQRLVTHVAGASVGNTMQALRKLRAKHPEMLAKLDIMSQPAATMDGVLMTWVIEEQALRMPVSLALRDCLGASFVREVSLAKRAGMQIESNVAAKLTATLQVTDTDVSRKLKAIVRKRLDEHRMRGQHELHEKGLRETWSAGLFEIIESITNAQDELVATNESEEWVLAAFRRNGWLAWRPDAAGGMRPAAEEEWASKMPMGTTRMRADWLEHRMRWLDENGNLT